MNTPSELKESLARCRQISLTVTGRKSGKTITLPVWHVLDGNHLYLVHGSETHWYRNVLNNPRIRVNARGGVEVELRAKPIGQVNAIESLVEKFRDKYGSQEVKRHYSKFDVAISASIEP